MLGGANDLKSNVRFHEYPPGPAFRCARRAGSAGGESSTTVSSSTGFNTLQRNCFALIFFLQVWERMEGGSRVSKGKKLALVGGTRAMGWGGDGDASAMTQACGALRAHSWRHRTWVKGKGKT